MCGSAYPCKYYTASSVLGNPFGVRWLDTAFNFECEWAVLRFWCSKLKAASSRSTPNLLRPHGGHYHRLSIQTLLRHCAGLLLRDSGVKSVFAIDVLEADAV